MRPTAEQEQRYERICSYLKEVGESSVAMLCEAMGIDRKLYESVIVALTSRCPSIYENDDGSVGYWEW